MNERRQWNKYLIWAGIAVACLVVDAGFFVVVGGAIKWLASVASPAVWAAIAVIGIVAARVLRLLGEARFSRGDVLQRN